MSATSFHTASHTSFSIFLQIGALGRLSKSVKLKAAMDAVVVGFYQSSHGCSGCSRASSIVFEKCHPSCYWSFWIHHLTHILLSAASPNTQFKNTLKQMMPDATQSSFYLVL